MSLGHFEQGGEYDKGMGCVEWEECVGLDPSHGEEVCTGLVRECGRGRERQEPQKGR